MKSIAISVALAAIIALGVAATVSASSRSAKNPAACDSKPSCATMSAADCGDCPPDCQPCPWPCTPGAEATASR